MFLGGWGGGEKIFAEELETLLKVGYPSPLSYGKEGANELREGKGQKCALLLRRKVLLLGRERGFSLREEKCLRGGVGGGGFFGGLGG